MLTWSQLTVSEAFLVPFLCTLTKHCPPCRCLKGENVHSSSALLVTQCLHWRVDVDQARPHQVRLQPSLLLPYMLAVKHTSLGWPAALSSDLMAHLLTLDWRCVMCGRMLQSPSAWPTTVSTLPILSQSHLLCS